MKGEQSLSEFELGSLNPLPTSITVTLRREEKIREDKIEKKQKEEKTEEEKSESEWTLKDNRLANYAFRLKWTLERYIR